MKYNIKQFFIFLFVTSNIKHKFGYTIVYKNKLYMHLKFGLFIRKFFSLTFKKIYEVSFLNSQKQLVKVHVFRKEFLKKYKDLDQFKVETRLIWKK